MRNRLSGWAIAAALEKEISRFEWHYDETEECYLLEGRVTVETQDEKKV